jgi:hypothetical protein
VLIALLAAPGVGFEPRPATAQSPLPDVDVVLVLEIADAAGWIAVQGEVLVTPPAGPKPLGVSVAATTGGRRSIMLGQPRFEVALIKGIPAFRVTVHGKMPVSEALGALGAFEHAIIEKQAGPGDSELGLSYGLSTVTARFLEMYVTRP